MTEITAIESNVFELIDNYEEDVVIKIISVSESGDETIRDMENHIDGVEFIYSNVIEDKTNIREVLKGTDMVFLIGATDNKEINEIAAVTDELEVLTLAVMTKRIPREASENFNVTQLLCHVNENQVMNNVLSEAIQSITNLLIHSGMINIDIGDIRTVLFGKNNAIIGVGSATGENRATEATKKALSSPLFQNADLKSVRNILVNISATNIELAEFSDVGGGIYTHLSESEIVKIGTSIKVDLEGVIDVAVIAAV